MSFGAPDTFVVPPATLAESGVALEDMSAVELANVPPALDGIEAALPVYPPGFYASLCKAIFISGPFAPPRERAGGTYGQRWIVLVADGSAGHQGIYETARFGVHHEFSSLVWHLSPGTRTLWALLLPPRWSPASGSEAALEESSDLVEDAEDGFLTAYGATSTENDFNTYAETAFLYPSRLRALAMSHPIVRSKTALLMEAYVELDERMTSVFDDLGLSDLAEQPGATLEFGIDAGSSSIPSPAPERISPAIE